MRIWVLLMVQQVRGCLEGFYGPACLLCPGNSSCNGFTRQGCAAGLFSMPGSKECYVGNSSFSLGYGLAPVTWSGPSAPYVGSASCGCFRNNVSAAVALDLGRAYWIGGVATASLGGAWVRSFMASVSNGSAASGTATWRPVGGLFVANVDDVSVVESKFPFPVLARYVRLDVVDYFLWPSLRAVPLSVADAVHPVDSTAEPPVPTTTTVLGTTSHTLPASTTSSAASTVLATTTPSSTPPPTTTVPETTSPVRTCRRLPNTVLATQGEPCAYACAPGTYNHSGACVALPRRSPAPSRNLSCAVRWRRQRPLWSRVHAFGSVLALETREALRGDMAIRLNDGPWMAWSWRQWAPVAPDASSSSQWLLLPEAPTFAGLWLRVRGANNSLLDVRRGRAIRHGQSVAASRPRGTLRWAWGMGGTATRGDSQALLALWCGTGNVGLIDGANATLRAELACGANATAGVPWLRGVLELRGVDGLLQSYLHAQCARGAQAWAVPGGERSREFAGTVGAQCVQ